jgi:hypothetical protein
MRAALIESASILIAALAMHLLIRLANIGLPRDKHWEDKTWGEFIATQFRLYHPTVAARFSWTLLCVAIAVGLVAYAFASYILQKVF